MQDLRKLIQEHPNITIAVDGKDLEKMFADIATEQARAIAELEAKRKTARLETPAEAKQRLGNVSDSTLWRWQKSGYLIPVIVGGQKRYKSTDIDRILEG